MDVIGKDDAGRRWSIGEMARASGMTVRALRHYDEIGLLAARTDAASGHRRYTEHDVRRLYRVRALRTLGLSLEEIAGVLADSEGDLAAMRDLLTAQLRGLEAHAVRIQQLTHRSRAAGTDRRRVDARSGPVHDDLGDDLCVRDLIHDGAAGATGPAQDRARTGGRRGGQDRMGGARRELLRHVQDGTPVEDPQVQALVGRWDALASGFHSGGEDGERTKAAARRTWEENSEEIGRSLPWPADRMRDLVDYLEAGPGRPDSRGRRQERRRRRLSCRDRRP